MALRITSERAEECMKAVSVEGAAVLEIWHKFETKWRMKMEWRKTTEEEEAEEEEQEEEEEEEDQDDFDDNNDDKGKEVEEVEFGKTELAELKVKET